MIITKKRELICLSVAKPHREDFDDSFYSPMHIRDYSSSFGTVLPFMRPFYCEYFVCFVQVKEGIQQDQFCH